MKIIVIVLKCRAKVTVNMNNIQKAMLSSIICNMIVWYEVTLFGVLITTISSVFFGSENSSVSIMKSLGTFSIGFCFRPVGAIIFGHMADKHGRKNTLIVSVIIISISSTAIGIMPGYDKIGIAAPIMLLICRILQGIVTGGETSINTAFLIEHSEGKKNLGFLGSIKSFSGALGSLMCFLIIAICKSITCENYDIWGWRVPFYLCFFFGIIGFITRYIMEESLAYRINKDNMNLSYSPFLDLIRNYKRPFAISTGLGVAQNAIIYSMIMFYNIVVKEFRLLQVDGKAMIRITSEITFSLSAVFFGILSDRIGRKNAMVPILASLVLLGFLVLYLMSFENIHVVWATYLFGSIVLGGSFGMYNSIACELFPTKVRCIGCSLSHNVSAGFIGGLSPPICMWLIEKTDTKLMVGIYLAICALISLVSVLQIRTRDRKVDW